MKLNNKSILVSISAIAINKDLAYGDIWIPIELYNENKDYFKNQIKIPVKNLGGSDKPVYCDIIQRGIPIKNVLGSNLYPARLHKKYLSENVKDTDIDEVNYKIRSSDYKDLDINIFHEIAENTKVDLQELVDYNIKVINLVTFTGLFHISGVTDVEKN